MFSNNKATEQVLICKHNEGVSLSSFGYHIKSKRTVFSDVNGQKCLFGMVQLISKENVCHFIAAQHMIYITFAILRNFLTI